MFLILYGGFIGYSTWGLAFSLGLFFLIFFYCVFKQERHELVKYSRVTLKMKTTQKQNKATRTHANLMHRGKQRKEKRIQQN